MRRRCDNDAKLDAESWRPKTRNEAGKLNIETVAGAGRSSLLRRGSFSINASGERIPGSSKCLVESNWMSRFWDQRQRCSNQLSFARSTHASKRDQMKQETSSRGVAEEVSGSCMEMAGSGSMSGHVPG